MTKTLVSIVLDILNTYPQLNTLNVDMSDLIALISYICDDKCINSQDGFEDYLQVTDNINKLLVNFYHKKALESNLFKVGGILLLKDKLDSYYKSEEFSKLRKSRKTALIKQFPIISTILVDLQYQEDLIQ